MDSEPAGTCFEFSTGNLAVVCGGQRSNHELVWGQRSNHELVGGRRSNPELVEGRRVFIVVIDLVGFDGGE